jgi:hypothetical protein
MSQLFGRFFIRAYKDADKKISISTMVNVGNAGLNHVSNLLPNQYPIRSRIAIWNASPEYLR